MQNLDRIIVGIGLVVFGVAIMLGITPIALTGPPAFLLGLVFVVIGGAILSRSRKTNSK